MLYTLLKFLGWGVLLAFIGGCIGWALRALKCRSEVSAARASTVDADEVERMRHRLANLEQVVAERDRLRIQLADVRHADSPGIVGAEIPEPAVADSAPVAEPEPPTDAADDSPPEPDRSAVAADDEPSIVPEADADTEPDPDAETDEGDAAAAGSATVAGFAATDDVAPAAAVDLDLDAAADVLGTKIALDDLTVVEGIGPKISELCNGIGVTTWRELADSDIADLQSMLDAAGSRYTVHKPGTWPRQAALLATGKWVEFKTMTEELDGGK